MPDTQTPPSASSTRSCVTGSLVGRNEDGSKIKIIPMFCHKWTCPRCRVRKASHWKKVAVAGHPERFLTLTLRENENLSPKFQAQVLKKAFAKLVKEIRIKWGIFEYFMVFELTKKGTPHVHILQRGDYIEKKWLSDMWKKLTGAFVVDIKWIKDPKDVARYISKYMGKALGQASEALSGLRIIHRSKGYVIDDPIKKQISNQGLRDDVFTWYWVSMKPQEVTEWCHTFYETELVSDQFQETLVLRAPPDLPVIEALLDHVTS